MSSIDLRAIPALQKVVVREGVLLRPLEATDAERVLAMLDEDPSIREHVSVAAKFRQKSDVVAEVERLKNDKETLRYVICEHESIVGMMNLWRAGKFFGAKAKPNNYGFGYFLAPEGRGRGLVTTSLLVLMDIAQRELGATSFVAFCEADNAASGAVLKKAGFAPTDKTWTEPTHGWTEQKYQRNVTG